MLEILQHDTALWVLFSFILFVVIAFKFGKASVLNTLDARIQSIRNEIEQAETLKAEAQKMLGEFEAKQRDAEAEARRLLENAQHNANQLRQQAEADLSEAMARKEAQLIERLKRIEDKAMADIKNHAAELAVSATSQIISKTLTKDISESLTSRSIEGLGSKIN